MNLENDVTDVKILNEYYYDEELEHVKMLGGDAEKYQEQGMDYAQLVEIRRGLESGFDVRKYDKPNIPWFQMEEIRIGLEEGIDLKEYFEAGFDWMQLSEIRIGKEHNLDVTIYAKKEYISQQMREIRIGLENNIDVSKYMDPAYDWFQMEEIRKAMEKNIDLIPYVEKGYSPEFLLQIRRCLDHKIIPDGYLKDGYDAEQLEQILMASQKEIDINPYLSPDMVGIQLEEIIKGLEVGVDVSLYADVKYSWLQMREIRLGLQAGYDVSNYAKLMYSVTDMHRFREKLLENEKEQVVVQAEVDVAIGELSTSFVTVSDDGMEAELNLAEPRGRAKYTEQDVIGILKTHGVTLGIDKEVIKLILEKEMYGQKIVVARGQRAVPGNDGHYEFYFRTQLPTLPKILEDGSVDYRNMDYFEKVSQGQKLATYYPSTMGKGGYTVNGKITIARKGKELPVLRGAGFVVLDDKVTYVSTLNGKVTIAGYHMVVSKLHIVEGDVTYTTGNITFDGDLIVRGCVRSGVTLQAKGNIEIDGNVESANLIADADILVKQGVQAGCRCV